MLISIKANVKREVLHNLLTAHGEMAKNINTSNIKAFIKLTNLLKQIGNQEEDLLFECDEQSGNSPPNKS